MRGIPARKALTLIECLLATAILSGAVLAASFTVVAGNQQAMYCDRATAAGRLASDFFEEIASKSFADPGQNAVFGLEAGETTRAQFNDVDDYNGYSQPAGRLVDSAGTPYSAENQVFSLSATVAPTTQNFLNKSIEGDLVTLVLTHVNGEKWTFTRFIPEP